jgi:hypothetical protein
MFISVTVVVAGLDLLDLRLGGRASGLGNLILIGAILALGAGILGDLYLPLFDFFGILKFPRSGELGFRTLVGGGGDRSLTGVEALSVGRSL